MLNRVKAPKCWIVLNILGMMALPQILSHIFCFLTKAQEIFDNLRLSNVVQLWTSLIRGYVENGENKEALNCVQLMQDQGYVEIGFCEDMLVGAKQTFSQCTISPCKGHRSWFDGNEFVGNSLIDMYIKCGLIMGLMEMCLWETL